MINETTINNPLGNEKISKLLYKFSVPATIGMIVNALYNIVDRIFIGNSPDLSTYGLAAITICFPAMVIMMAFGIGLGQGASTLFSINLGRGNHKKARKALGNVIMVALIVSLIILVIGEIFLDQLLIIFGASETILPFAREYMRIVFLGSPFLILSMTMNNMLRANGKPKLAMYTMFIGAVINIALDPILIYVLRMGMTGAALATIFSQFVTMAWCLYNFIDKNEENRIQKEYLKLDTKLIKEILNLGLPGFLLQIANSSLLLILNASLIVYGGDLAVSAMGIINSIQTLLILPIIGVNQGLQPIVSFNYGANKNARVKEAVKIAIITSTIIAITGTSIAEIFPKALVELFNQDGDLIKMGTFMMRVWFMFVPLAGFQIIAANFFQAIGKPKMAMFLTLTRQVIFLIPAVIVFSKISGLKGILFAAPFADLSSTLITFYFFYNFIKRFK